jgi:DNA-binding response OmpR family regulator
MPFMVKKILVVEDSIVMAKALSILFKKEGFEVFTEDDGHNVPGLVKKDRIDIVILDLMMPKLSGKDVLKALKNDPETKKIPVILLTARTDVLKWDDELKICDKFMQKPFDNNELVREVNALLEMR